MNETVRVKSAPGPASQRDTRSGNNHGGASPATQEKYTISAKKVKPENDWLAKISIKSYLCDLSGELKKNFLKNCTSIPALNRRIRRIEGFGILAGEAKSGKSTLAQQIAEDYARQGISVLYYDFEMGWKRFFSRTFQRKTGFVIDDELQRKDKTQLYQAFAEWADEYWRAIGQNFFYRGNSHLREIDTIGRLVRRDIQEIRRATKKDNVVIFVDSLQKLPIVNHTDRRTSIDIWLRTTEGIVAEGVTVIAVSELSRDGKYKESGDIEYTADNCMELTCPDKSDPDSLILSLPYSRDYETGKICDLHRERPKWKFVEVMNEGLVAP